MKLTDRAIKALKATGQRFEVYDDLIPGLALRVTPQGIKSWSLRYRVGGQQMPRLTLGRYPTVTLEKARKKAQHELRAVDDGVNPAAEKRATRQGETVADLAKEYLEKHAKPKKRSWREDERILTVDVLPAWRYRKVKDLTRRDVRELIERIVDRGAPIMANRTWALVSTMLNFALARDWIGANPAALLPKPGAERSRERVLTDDEIRLVWTACEGERPPVCALMRLRLLTAQRGGELAALRWSDVDGDWLTIPSAVTKNKLAHRVPLTAPAKVILDGLPRIEGCEFIFFGRGNRPLTDAKQAGRRIATRVLATLRAENAAVEAFDFRGHDLRRTAATKMAEAGVAQHDIAKVLNHVDGSPRATHVYNRYTYDREKRIALETWARVLTGILERTDDGKVLAFTMGASR